MAHLRPPKAVLDIARRLEAAGFEAWCVGGGVRDALLEQPHLDWDIATQATPDQVREIFGRRRTIPVGIEFGTVGVLDDARVLHEVTTFRRDVRTDGRHAVVEFGASLDEDLARRDFTINAIAYSPSSEELRDPFGGRSDLNQGIVRAVGDPDARMAEDRLRALRAIRFAARFGFEIDPATFAAIERSARHLGRLSAERVKQEMEKTMDQVRCPGDAFLLWRRTGVFATLIPALADADDAILRSPDYVGMPGPPGRPRRRLDRFAALFVQLPPAAVAATLSALRFSRQDANWITDLAERWHEVGREMEAGLASTAVAGGGQVADATVRQWVAAVGRTRVGSFMRVASAVWQARAGDGAGRGWGPSPAAVRSLYRRVTRSAFRDPVELADLAVDGDDLRRVGIAPGPGLGKILQDLLAAVVEDPSRNTTDWLLQETERIRGREQEEGEGGRSAER